MAYAVQWLRAVEAFGKATNAHAAERMKILRTSWYDVRLLENSYTTTKFPNMNEVAKEFNQLCSDVGRSMMFADRTQSPSLANGTAISGIPADVNDQEFQKFFTELVKPGLKSMTYLYAGGPHALGIKGFGDRILYFDPNDGEFEMDSDGYFNALSQHGAGTGDDELYNAWFITIGAG